MKKNNLIEMYVVGKYMSDKQFKLIHLSPTDKGWMQTCSDRALDCEYVSEETIPDLLDWFKCEYLNYRIFQNSEEAKMYLNEKTSASNPAR